MSAKKVQRHKKKKANVGGEVSKKTAQKRVIKVQPPKKKTISLVAIVKNEEAVLERCLESVKGIVDEFIVVDTGSTDKTKEIIQRYGHLYELPYTTEVETRQKAIAFATGDYVLLMDGDEWVVSNLNKLRQYADNDIDVVSTRIHDVTADMTIVTNKYFRNRMFKNEDDGPAFTGPGAHGYVASKRPAIVDRSVLVYHTHDHKKGDDTKATDKVNRTLGPLEAAVKKNPNDSRGWFYLARTYMLGPKPDFKKAIKTFQHYLGLITSTFAEERWWAVYDIARCYSYLKDYAECSIACDRALEMDPKRAEAYNLKGQVYYLQEQWAVASFYFKEAMTLQEPDGQLFIDPREYWEVPADYLATCMHKLGNVWGAFELTRALIGRKGFVDSRLINNMNEYEKEMTTRKKPS